MDSSEENVELTKEEADKLAKQTIEENKETLGMLEGELKEFGEFEKIKEKFYNKFGFTDELIAASKDPPIGESEMDESVQEFFDHFFKEMTANQAAKGVDEPKKKKAGVRLSRRGKMI